MDRRARAAACIHATQRFGHDCRGNKGAQPKHSQAHTQPRSHAATSTRKRSDGRTDGTEAAAVAAATLRDATVSAPSVTAEASSSFTDAAAAPAAAATSAALTPRSGSWATARSTEERRASVTWPSAGSAFVTACGSDSASCCVVHECCAEDTYKRGRVACYQRCRPVPHPS